MDWGAFLQRRARSEGILLLLPVLTQRNKNIA